MQSLKVHFWTSVNHAIWCLHGFVGVYDTARLSISKIGSGETQRPISLLDIYSTLSDTRHCSTPVLVFGLGSSNKNLDHGFETQVHILFLLLLHTLEREVRHYTIIMSSQLFERSSETSSIRDDESGYASGTSSQESFPELYFSKPHLKFLNLQLQKLEPQGMLTQMFPIVPHTHLSLQIFSDGVSRHCLAFTRQPPSACPGLSPWICSPRFLDLSSRTST